MSIILQVDELLGKRTGTVYGGQVSGDSLRVQNYFTTDGASSYVVENLKFADGTVWDVTTVKAKVLISTEANDTLRG